MAVQAQPSRAATKRVIDVASHLHRHFAQPVVNVRAATPATLASARIHHFTRRHFLGRVLSLAQRPHILSAQVSSEGMKAHPASTLPRAGRHPASTLPRRRPGTAVILAGDALDSLLQEALDRNNPISAACARCAMPSSPSLAPRVSSLGCWRNRRLCLRLLHI